MVPIIAFLMMMGQIKLSTPERSIYALDKDNKVQAYCETTQDSTRCHQRRHKAGQ